MKSKILCVVLSVFMAAAALTGCNKETETENKLTYWMALSATTSAEYSNFGDTKIAQELEKKFNVDVEYIHPASGQSTEKFNVMIAMTNLPDIIEYTWVDYPGGPGKALSDNRIIDISEYLDMAPNFKRYLDEHEDIAKLVKTDDGKIIGFPCIKDNPELNTSAGLVLRKDWLDELGLDVPETINEWETVLTAFKEKKGASAPLSILPLQQFPYGAFSGAYGTTAQTYIEDGQVKYGPAEPAFKDFLVLMNKWYNAGLLDPSIATQDYKGLDANILSGTSGATVGSIGSGIGKWLVAATETGFDLVAAPYPTLNKGEKAKFGQCVLPVNNTFSCISTSCKNVELAIKYLDYGYSEEGRRLYNFGIEGESYTMENGKPIYTDLIVNNPDGKSMNEIMSTYIRAHEGGPFIQEIGYMEQYAKYPQQQEAWKVWSNTDASKYLMPYLYLENANDIAKCQTAVNTYYQEMVIKFVMGIEPIDNFEAYVTELNKRGLDKILTEQQAAYDRYLNR